MKFPFVTRSKYECLLIQYELSQAKNKRLMAELVQAKKNDSPKDPKTGKFTKKK